MASEFDNELEAPEMEALANLAENLIYRLPGIADVMVRKTIQEVYRDFCRRSCCLHGRRHLKIGHDCEGKVLFAPLYGGMVDLVTDVCINGHRLYDTDYVNRGGTVHLPRRFVPSAFDVYDIDALVVEIPAMSSENVPSWFVQRHGDSICSGVLARLMSMTGKPWSDPAQAQIERVAYENAVIETRTRYYAQNDYGDLGMAGDERDLI